MLRTWSLLLAVCLSKLCFACDCSVKPSLDTAIARSKVIISGVVVQKEKVRILREADTWTLEPDSVDYFESPFKFELVKYVIAVDNRYKGKKLKDTLTVYSEATTSLCGYMFEIGKHYIAYLDSLCLNKNGKFKFYYWTDACTRTDVYTEAEEEELKKRLRR